MGGRSRLRRREVSDRWYFMTYRVLRRQRSLSESELGCWACPSLQGVQFFGYVLTADLDFTFVLAGLGEIIGKLHP